MATFIVLGNFTEQGIRNAKESPNRASTFAADAEALGVKVKDIYWTVGHYDAVAVLEGPDDGGQCILSLICGDEPIGRQCHCVYVFRFAQDQSSEFVDVLLGVHGQE